MIEGAVVFEGIHNGVAITIRHVQRYDVEKLLAYINTLSKEHTFIRYQGEQLTIEEENRYMDDFMNKVRTQKAVKLLVFHASELIGVADIHLQDKIARHVGILGITIKVGWRKKGIGAFLMQKTLEEGVKHMKGMRIITLGVFGNNPIAQKMYEKFGFKEYGKLPGGVQYEGELVDHIYMYKEAY